VMLTARLPQSNEIQAKLENSGMELVDFDRREGGYRLRVGSEDLDQRRDLLGELIAMAFRNHVA
jgi:hypothetical protein